MEDENNVDEFAKLLASYIYTFDYMVSYFQKFAEDDKEMNMKKFKNLLGSSYPQIEKLEGVSPDEKISSYVFKFIEKNRE